MSLELHWRLSLQQIPFQLLNRSLGLVIKALHKLVSYDCWTPFLQRLSRLLIL